jgi:hypothetical protein
VQEREDQLSLRRETTALRAVLGGNEFGGLHEVETIRSECLFASRADKVGVVSRHTASSGPHF